MILYTFPSSPFGCKVKSVILACAEEKNITIEEFHPWQPDSFFRELNPLGKIPTLKIDNNESIFDSAVICEYIIEKAKKSSKLMPNRIKSLKIQALIDGMADAAVSIRYERFFRPQHLQCEDWYNRQYLALESGLKYLNSNLKKCTEESLCFENLCIATFLSYIDLRFSDSTFRENYKNIFSWYDQFRKDQTKFEPAMAKDKPVPDNILRLNK